MGIREVESEGLAVGLDDSYVFSGFVDGFGGEDVAVVHVSTTKDDLF